MKNQYAITISDVSGSKHYFVKNTIKRTLIIAGITVFLVMLTLGFFVRRKKD